MPSGDAGAGRASVVCRIALAAALLGIASGVVLSVTMTGADGITFDGISVPPFATWMLAPMVLGSAAAVLSSSSEPVPVSEFELCSDSALSPDVEGTQARLTTRSPMPVEEARRVMRGGR
jgi:hypothetical protein